MFGVAWGVGSLLLLVGLGEGFRSGNKRGLAEYGEKRSRPLGNHLSEYILRAHEPVLITGNFVAEMKKLGVEPDARVKRRFNLSMQYAVDKAVRRGIKQLPLTLHRFVSKAA